MGKLPLRSLSNPSEASVCTRASPSFKWTFISIIQLANSWSIGSKLSKPMSNQRLIVTDIQSHSNHQFQDHDAIFATRLWSFGRANVPMEIRITIRVKCNHSSCYLQCQRIGFSDDGDDVNDAAQAFQNLQIQRPQVVSRRRNEVEAAVDSCVGDGTSAIDALLLLQIRVVLPLDVAQRRLPTVSIISISFPWIHSSPSHWCVDCCTSSTWIHRRGGSFVPTSQLGADLHGGWIEQSPSDPLVLSLRVNHVNVTSLYCRSGLRILAYRSHSAQAWCHFLQSLEWSNNIKMIIKQPPLNCI